MNDEAHSPANIRRGYTVGGQVQGVGFRPFVYRVARTLDLSGTVQNTPAGVRIEVQGLPAAVDAFGRALSEEAPALARISACTEEPLPLDPDSHDFRILHSAAGQGHCVLISPDTATCPDCLADIADPANRRHRYAFTNCTNCGPRYTIIRAIPYDRPNTSMACFPLCPDCGREYSDPQDRRFHAQPNACPVCGPRVWLCGNDGVERSHGFPAIEQTAQALVQGAIAAIKGLGGFHLACLAAGAVGHQATAELRRRKNRPDKPLAIMVPDLETARSLAHVNATAEAMLSGVQRPITLCPLRPETISSGRLAPEISPDTDFVGLMLPYAPLHHILLAAVRDLLRNHPDVPVALVMTSGNMSSEPISLGNREALHRLGAIADLFLLHNRDILIRTDDSVVRPLPGAGQTQFLRRARGFTPEPIFLANAGPAVLGLGAELKNTLCLTKQDQAFVSQYIGDMQNLETFRFYNEIAEHLQLVLQTKPAALIHDLHPDYLSTRYALEQTEFPSFALQHHYAHIHAALAEHRHVGPALGWALDGAGLGEDGVIWGGELLFVDTQTLEQRRLCHFAPFRLPGGEAAIREPWRTAQSCLWELGQETPSGRPWTWLEHFEAPSRMLPELLRRNLRAPMTTSCGRLFDAVAALLGLKHIISYEGQAAIILERIQGASDLGHAAYSCPLDTTREPAVLRTLDLFRQVAADWERGVAAATISRKFHLGLIDGLVAAAAWFSRQLGVTAVALSGGVMQNQTLAAELPKALTARGLAPLVHLRLPPNDGCISLGQAAWGRRRCE